jgi:hypothetical protein
LDLKDGIGRWFSSQIGSAREVPREQIEPYFSDRDDMGRLGGLCGADEINPRFSGRKRKNDRCYWKFNLKTLETWSILQIPHFHDSNKYSVFGGFAK